jgi:hypothetical protein
MAGRQKPTARAIVRDERAVERAVLKGLQNAKA